MRRLLYIENIFAFLFFSYYVLVFSNINFIFILGNRMRQLLYIENIFTFFIFSYYDLVFLSFIHFYFGGIECVNYYI